MSTVADITASLDRFAPANLAAQWDNVGLLLGDPAASVSRAMTCLTVSPEVVAEAVAEKVDLIVSHHPVLFRGAKRLSMQTAEGRLLSPLLRAGTAVYSPHTSFDNCPGGINDGLCRRLGLQNVEPLRPREGPRSFKLIVFVPDSDLAKVSDAVFAAGAGFIGQYSECSYRLMGKGTFFGNENTNPAVGQKGRREEMDEWRLELLVTEEKLTAVILAMRKAHSYEEPAFDVYALKAASAGGEGRIGNLTAPESLRNLAMRMKSLLRANSVQIVGDPRKLVSRVAVACGAAGEFLLDSSRGKADLFLTGEIRFHEALAAEALGLGLLLPGHYATERPGIEDLAEKLAKDWPEVTVWPSRQERDPLQIA